MSWNPLKIWLDHDARQRELDREAMLLVVREVVSAGNSQAEVAAQQTKLMQQFFSQFLNFDGTPTSRTIRDEDEAEAERLRWYWHQSNTPGES